MISFQVEDVLFRRIMNLHIRSRTQESLLTFLVFPCEPVKALKTTQKKTLGIALYCLLGTVDSLLI